MAVTHLDTLQHRYGSLVDAEIERWIEAAITPGDFALMLRYALGFCNAQGQAAHAGGKRFRPILCLLACQACGGQVEHALSAAAAIELLHNFSLIHDDIEDRDRERRHRPALWTVWGEPKAINAGDAMFALAARAVLGHGSPQVLAGQLGAAFADVTIQLTRGQHLDMSFESRPDVTPDEYIEMISLKSAALISFSLEAGALIASATPAARAALAAYGADLGRAFQIWDDIHGIWGSTARTGKQEAKDLENRKKTLPVLMGLRRAAGPSRAVLERYMDGEEVDLAEVRHILTECGAQQEAVSAAGYWGQRARVALNEAGINPDVRGQLENLALELLG